MTPNISTWKALSTLGNEVYLRNDIRTRRWLADHAVDDDHLVRRMRAYTRLSAITTCWFTSLHGRRPSPRERQLALRMGAFTPLYDDLMDEHGWTHRKILGSLSSEEPSFQLVRSLLNEIRQEVKRPALFDQVLDLSGQAQNASLAQVHSAPLHLDELLRITRAKGNAFTLIYRVILDHPLVDGEEEAIASLGFLLQLTNDLFDIHKDIQAGQQTLVTQTLDMSSIRDLWETELERFGRSWCHLPCPRSGIRQSLYQIAILLGRGEQALQNLIRLQDRQGGHFQPEVASRSDLICDMERPSNVWSSLCWSSRWTSATLNTNRYLP